MRDESTVRLYLTLDDSSRASHVAKQLSSLDAINIDVDGNRIFFSLSHLQPTRHLQSLVHVERLCLCLFNHDITTSASGGSLLSDPPDWSVIDAWFEAADLPLASKRWAAFSGRAPRTWAFNARRRGERCRRCIDQQELLTRSRNCVERLLPTLDAVRYAAGGERDELPLPDLAVQLMLTASRACAGVLLLDLGTAPTTAKAPPPPLLASSSSLFSLNLRPPADGVTETTDARVLREVAWSLRSIVAQLEAAQRDERRAKQRHEQRARRQLRALAAPAAAAAGEVAADSDGDGAWARLAPLLLPLPLPCVYCDRAFLGGAEAAHYLRELRREGAIAWAHSPRRANRATAVYGDENVDYRGAAEHGYASETVHAWTPALLELRARVEAWCAATTGVAHRFSACLLNRYDGGAHGLGWHADREEIDPALNAPRPSPIASLSLGASRTFGLRLKADVEGVHRVRLTPGSLLVMENATQLLYHHALLPEDGDEEEDEEEEERDAADAAAGADAGAGGDGDGDGLRINLTFRSHRSTPEAVEPSRPPTAASAAAAEAAEAAEASCSAAPLCVGLTAGVQHLHEGFKQQLFHPFETPFVTDAPDVAARRYRAWLDAQPAFRHFVCERLRGRELEAGDDAFDQAHARVLEAMVAESQSVSRESLIRVS